MPVRDIDRIPQTKDALREAAADAVEDLTVQTYRAMDRAWGNGRSALGIPWVPLSERRIREKGHDAILIDIGEMRADTQYRVERDELQSRIGPVTRRSGELLELHEVGVPENNLPARPVLGPAGDYAIERADEVFEEHIDDGLTVSIASG